MFEGYAPDTSENGVFLMGETGFTPQVGASKLPGRYAFGWYYYQEDNDEFGTEKYGFYWQADQMLWREPGGVAGELSPQGLRMFSLFNFTPNGFNIRYPFNFQAGLVYEGLVPSRDADQLIAGLAFAEYSEKSRAGKDPAPTNTTFLEAGYRVKVNGWAFIQPFVQVIARPEGVPDVANAAILGVFAGVDF
jgi:carbohydrate-selective porin OprB